MNNAVIIMAKVPEAGKVKTRLQPRLTPEQSAELAECLLRDTITKVAGEQNQLIIAYSPADGRDFFDQFSQHKIIYLLQKGLDLGERMFNAFDFAFAQKMDSVVMIGTDSPTFPAKYIDNAFEYLESSDAVLGETEDGGYYLIGLRTLKQEIFENVEWSSPETFKQTAENLRNLGLNVSFLPKWYDVDEPEEFERLIIEFLENPALAENTARWIAENV
jgi:rSAM/selenodomain-associated transferase 1